ncbi:hypothetical protein [Melaminivora sp.]|uniref:hypothetical protein n=1 Tax=Melaminivora sp. TaxID=1933032 RepID=UPI0028AE2E04|nr:hypothetical protein [Melaminivora sp.]
MPSHLSPPPARHPFGRAALPAQAIAVASVTALAGVALWAAQGLGSAHWAAGIAASLLLWAVCSAAAWRAWRVLPRGVLQWDGAGWVLEPAAPGQHVGLACAPEVALDLQNALLLRVQPLAGRASWLWLQQADAPAQWLPMRRALHAAGAQALPARPAAPGAESSA